MLLDVHLPRMDGLSFLRALRAGPLLNSLVVVMLSTSGEGRDKRDALALHAAGCLLKSTSFPSSSGS